ncbi:MAG: SNF2-related protein [Burkholderiales bacterium]
MSQDYFPRLAQQKIRDHILYHNACNIWAEPGVGKTGGTYEPIEILRLLGSHFFPWLVVAPKRVAVDVWPREQKKWNQFHDLRVVNLAGREDAFDRIEQLRRGADIFVINYDLAQWLVEHFETKKIAWPFRGVVADEATKLKSFRLRNGGKRAMALAKMQKYVGRWVNLTGTPSPNGLIDLWGQCWFLDRGERLGRTFGEFKERYFIEDPYTNEIRPRPGSDEQIMAKLSDITLSLRAADYFDLPPITHNHIFANLSPPAMEQYRRMETEMFVELEGKSAEAMNAATVTMKCLQMASGAVYTGDTMAAGPREWAEFDTAKLDALDSLLNDMNGEPLLTAYHWKFEVERVKKRFPYTREIKTSEDIDDWNKKRIRHALIHPASAGHGIDLAVGGHHLAFLDPWWDAEQYSQIIERLGPTRQVQHGLNRPVFLHHIIAAGTLDEAVVERRLGKLRVQDVLLARMRK